MLILRGSPALSPFRLQKLAQDLAADGLRVNGIGAEFVHLAALSGDLSAEQRRVLEQLLTYGPTRAATAKGSGEPAAAAAATARAAEDPMPLATGISERMWMASRSWPATSIATFAAR